MVAHFGYPPPGPNIMCGPVFEEIQVNNLERAELLKEADEKFRIFYKMVEEILTLKEEEERVRQAAEAAFV